MTRRTRVRLEALGLLLFGLAGSFSPSVELLAAKSAPHSTATLRIGLWTLWHDREIIASPAPDKGATFRTCESCSTSPLKQTTQIHAVGDRLVFGNTRESATLWLTGAIVLAAHGETLTIVNPLRIAGRHGEIELAVALPTESYVERVVASESSAADSPESLKALAIVVRSFALHQKHGHAEYDVCDSTHGQLLHWGGNPERRAAAHAAALATTGETLWFHGRRAEAWFHQNCGGRTASPAEIWRASKPMPWLASRIDSYCTVAGAREWSANLSVSDISAALAAAGLVRRGWKTLAVTRRGESGRVVMLRLDSTEISAEAFRLAVGRTMGWNRILSDWFEVTQQGDRFIFHGRGSGHGVGLCQAGAAAMAASGRDSAEILAQYFTGAAAADEATGLSWQRIRGQGFTLETLDPTDSTYVPELGQALSEAKTRSGIKTSDPMTVRTFRSTPAFRDATLAPGWVAAFTEGNWICTQPLRSLAARRLLAPILRHEFLHALVESQSGPNAPLWLREGLVEVWNGEAHSTGPPPALQMADIDHALAHSASETQSAAAHRAAGWYAARLLNRFGRDRVVGWLRNGMPLSAMASLH